jgi:hypothetical protein
MMGKLHGKFYHGKEGNILTLYYHDSKHIRKLGTKHKIYPSSELLLSQIRFL